MPKGRSLRPLSKEAQDARRPLPVEMLLSGEVRLEQPAKAGRGRAARTPPRSASNAIAGEVE